MLDIICTRKEKIRVFLFFKLYKTVLNIFKSERIRVIRKVNIYLVFFFLYFSKGFNSEWLRFARRPRFYTYTR